MLCLCPRRTTISCDTRLTQGKRFPLHWLFENQPIYQVGSGARGTPPEGNEQSGEPVLWIVWCVLLENVNRSWVGGPTRTQAKRESQG